MLCSELVVVVESATKPSRFAHCSHGALVSCSVLVVVVESATDFHILLTIHTVHNPLRRPGKTTQHSNSHAQAREIPHVQAREISHVRASAGPYLAGQGTKATSIAFYWLSRLPFARLQTLQMPFWHPLPRRIYLPIYLSIYLSIDRSIYQSINLSLHTTLHRGGVGGTRALAHSIYMCKYIYLCNPSKN